MSIEGDNMFRTYFLLFMIYSFLGWCGEVIVSFWQHKKFINRGFLMGPNCPIYGCGCVLISLLLSKYADDVIVIFCMSMILCSVLEYITSFIMESIFKMRWWDYSDLKFNINGRICISYSVPFGIIGTLVVLYINPFFIEIFGLVPNWIIDVVVILLACLFVVDVIVSSNIIFNLKDFVRSSKKDSTEDLKKEIKKNMLNNKTLYMRLVNSFPDFKKIIKKPKKKLKRK